MFVNNYFGGFLCFLRKLSIGKKPGVCYRNTGSLAINCLPWESDRGVKGATYSKGSSIRASSICRAIKGVIDGEQEKSRKDEGQRL
jgi:hypothetical protein